MPKLYEEIRDQYVKKGMSYDKAQSIAAATYNTIRRKNSALPKLSNKTETKKK